MPSFRIITLTSVLISVFALTVAAQEQCEEGFVFNALDNLCYHVSRTATTWLEAKHACDEKKSKLVVITNFKTQQAIDHMLSSQARSGVYWIGLQQNGGVAKWVDKRPLMYSNFAEAMTNDEDHCAVLISSKTGLATWNYFDCSNKHFYICQPGAGTSTTRTTPTTTRTTPTTTRTTTMTTRMTTTPPNYCPSAGHPNYGPFSGTVSSPNFPNQYFNNANCVYTIVLQQSRATLTFTAFDTEPCCDFLYIYDGSSIQSPLIKRLSGTGYAGTTYKATYNTMTLRFTTDASGTASGWSGHYYSS